MRSMEAFWVSGTLEIHRAETAWGAAGYRLRVERIELRTRREGALTVSANKPAPRATPLPAARIGKDQRTAHPAPGKIPDTTWQYADT